MKNKRLEELQDKYFDGKTSSEEERELKKSDELFFQLLDQEKSVKMDWSFDEFENQIKADKKIIRWRANNWIKYTAAAILLAVMGFAFYLSQEPTTDPPVLADQQIKKPQETSAKDVTAHNEATAHSDVEIIVSGDKKRSTMLAANTSKHFNQRVPSKKIMANKKKVVQSLQQMEDGYQADYVVLNGKPVANEEEAVELTLKSLGLLANNLENGVDKAMNIKQMSISIN
ncbi:hypothetical protein [Sphingobacterium sp. HMA12]|uniref:hypothetical protein n=1 Tax=Sphingobacterium sp. HMA12 TaxID=2050894 RepID=UPI000CE9AFAA|nr:hypothetical protein [Sphingobacterium sp. HMA12]